MKDKVLNFQTFLEVFCYTIFSGLIFYLVHSEKYLLYVTPRMKPYLYFTAIVMLLWTFIGFSRLFRPQHKIRTAHCYVLVIPALLLLLPHKPLSSADLLANYTRGNIFTGRSAPTLTSASVENEGSSFLDSLTVNTSTKTPSADIWDFAGLDVENRIITVGNEDFGFWLMEIYANMEKYKEYEIVMTGFVFRDLEIFEEDEFIVARLMMSCCAADLVPTGLLCEYDKAVELKTDSWITVEGIIDIKEYEYDGQKYYDPQILVKNVTQADEVNGYIYPY